MGLFGNFDRRSSTLAVIDIHSGSVGAGYAHYVKAKEPTLVYAARVPVARHGEESLSFAMLRALAEASDNLVARGAPLLLRATGSGRADSLLVSIAPPWESTTVRVERIEEKEPFLFNRSIVDAVIAKTATAAPDRLPIADSVMATVLNGYETARPLGKQATLADIFILSSSMEKGVADGIAEVLRRSFHAHTATYTAFAPAVYAVLRELYPHEKDYLIIDVSGESTDVISISRGLLASIVSIPVGVNRLTRAPRHARSAEPSGEKTSAVHVIRDTGDMIAKETRGAWIEGLIETLKGFSEDRALPRRVFLFADPSAQEYLKNAINEPSLRSLWLSDEPLTVIAIAPQHLSSSVKVAAEAVPDAGLMALALSHGKRVDRFGA